MLIYQLLPRYWGGYTSENVRGGSLKENGCGHFSDIDSRSLDYFKSLGVTHMWYTGVIRHATHCDTNGCKPSHPQILKGEAGSPYAISDYYDVNPYLASNPDDRMKEFESLVERTHSKGMKVVIDFVPNHVSRDNVNFGRDDDKSVHWAPDNDFYYYPGQELTLPVKFEADTHYGRPYREFPARATGNNCFNPSPAINDWYETVKLNYCPFHTPTWDRMLDILRFWAGKGVDGFRCDMVELVPAEFFTWAIAEIKKEYPDVVFIAEVYDRGNYRHYLKNVGFDLLYDKSGLYDALHDIVRYNAGSGEKAPEPWQSTRRITANWQYLGDLQDGMLNFLENHDEQRLASDFFAGTPDRYFAALAVSALFNGASFMMYCGQEIGERGMDNEGFSGADGKSTIFDWWKPRSSKLLWQWVHKGTGLEAKDKDILDKYRHITELASMDVFRNGSTYDLCFCNLSSEGFDPDRHFAFLRYNDEIRYLAVCNFSSAPMSAVIDIPLRGRMERVELAPYDYCIKELR